MNTRTASVTGRRGFAQNFARLNWGIITCLCLIAFIGVMMHYSVAAGAWQDMPLTHATRFVGLLAICVFLAMAPARWFYVAAYPLYLFTMLLLIAVEVAGETRMGATRWLSVGPVSIQPSEIMKIAIVLTLARYYHDLKPHRTGSIWWTLPALLIVAAPVGLVM
ncbi:MAG: FtsW/RodA/SpoVE family cell cycle protein, partial [Hyphomonadaceae bacterium]